MPINSNDPVERLFNLAESTMQGRGRITRGEVRRYVAREFRALDTSGDQFINAQEMSGSVLERMIQLDINSLNLSAADKAKLQRAQELLRSVIRERIVPPAPTQDISGSGVEYDELITDPYQLSEQAMVDRWSTMRRGFAGQEIRVDVPGVRDRIRNLYEGNGRDANKLVEALWNDRDNVGGVETRVMRMEELIGVFKYAENLPADQKEGFLQSFFTAMGNYLNRRDTGLDPQFVLDSLLHVIQSTDFSGPGQDKLKEFLEGIVKGIVNNADAFKNKTGVVGNYDGTQEGGVFGSLAVVRNANGSVEFIEHDSPDPNTRKTKYLLSDGAAGTQRPPGAFAPGTQPPGTQPPGAAGPGRPGGPAGPGQGASNTLTSAENTINNVYHALDEIQRDPNNPSLQPQLRDLHGASEDLTGILRGLTPGTNPSPQALRSLAQRIRQVAGSLPANNPQVSQQAQRLNEVASQLEALAQRLESQAGTPTPPAGPRGVGPGTGPTTPPEQPIQNFPTRISPGVNGRLPIPEGVNFEIKPPRATVFSRPDGRPYDSGIIFHPDGRYEFQASRDPNHANGTYTIRTAGGREYTFHIEPDVPAVPRVQPGVNGRLPLPEGVNFEIKPPRATVFSTPDGRPYDSGIIFHPDGRYEFQAERDPNHAVGSYTIRTAGGQEVTFSIEPNVPAIPRVRPGVNGRLPLPEGVSFEIKPPRATVFSTPDGRPYDSGIIFHPDGRYEFQAERDPNHAVGTYTIRTPGGQEITFGIEPDIAAVPPITAGVNGRLPIPEGTSFQIKPPRATVFSTPDGRPYDSGIIFHPDGRYEFQAERDSNHAVGSYTIRTAGGQEITFEIRAAAPPP